MTRIKQIKTQKAKWGNYNVPTTYCVVIYIVSIFIINKDFSF